MSCSHCASLASHASPQLPRIATNRDRWSALFQCPQCGAYWEGVEGVMSKRGLKEISPEDASEAFGVPGAFATREPSGTTDFSRPLLRNAAARKMPCGNAHCREKRAADSNGTDGAAGLPPIQKTIVETVCVGVGAALCAFSITHCWDPRQRGSLGIPFRPMLAFDDSLWFSAAVGLACAIWYFIRSPRQEEDAGAATKEEETPE